MQNPIIIVMLTLAKLITGIRCSMVESRTVQVTVLLLSLMVANGLAVGREVYGAHTHGVANLTLAFENGTLEVQFELPAMSLLGFEHKPKTKEQVETIEKIKALLISPTKVMSLSGANCSPRTTNVDILGPAGQTIIDGHAQEHGDHGSDEQQLERGQSGANHSEVSAIYEFDCDDSKLQSVTVILFEHFSGLEAINVNWVTESQQGKAVLRPGSSTADLD